MRVLNLIDGGALVRDQSLAFDQKLILLCFATENGMVFEKQALHLRAGIAPEEQSGSESANSASNDYAVVGLPCVNDVFGKRIVHAVTKRMTSFENIPRVAVRGAVLADASVTREVITLSQ